MINYILHVSLLLGLGFILYQVLLKKETFYSLNRAILALYLILAFTLPTLQIPDTWSIKNTKPKIVQVENRPSEVHQTSPLPKANLQEKGVEIKTPKEPEIKEKISLSPINNNDHKYSAWNIDWQSAIKWTYLVGLGIFLINFLVQFTILIYYRLKYPTMKDGKMTIVEMPGDKAPFSFLNMIYINPTKYEYETYEQILAHEKIHISKWHSADIFLSEIALIFQWFNPFAWYYRKAVEHNLEYLTDREMLDSGANAEVYQMNLLKVSVPELPLALSTNYNQSFLKKRIQMMNTKKSSAQSTWKYLFILPILALTISMINPTFSTAQNETVIQTPELTTNLSSEEITIINPILDVNNGIRTDQVINPKTPFINQNPEIHNLSDYGISNSDQLTTSHKDGTVSMISGASKSFTLESKTGRTIVKNTEDDIELKGSWEAEIDGDNVCLYIKKGGIGKNYFWSSSECIKTSEFSPVIKSNAEGEFTLTRSAGTIILKGEFDGNEGNGRYDFQADASYTSYIKQQGFDIQDKKIIHFFLSDIDKQYFRFLKKEGYNNLDEDELLAMVIHNVDENYIMDINGEFQKVNYAKPSSEELVALKIHNVDLDYIKSFGKELHEDLSVDQIIGAAIHNVDPSYIKEFQKLGFEDLTFDNLISAAIHDVNPDYIKQFKNAGFKNLKFDDMISASIHNVNPDYIKTFQSAGLKDLDFDNLISAAIHNVDPNYLKEAQSYGFDLTFDQLISASIHDVDLDYLQNFVDVGLQDLDFDDMISASIHNADPNYFKEAKTYGFDLTFDQLISASIHNIDLEYIKTFNNAGIKDLDFDDVITAAIHNIDPNKINEFQNLGFDDLSFDNLVSLSIHNIQPEYIQELKSSGIEGLTFDNIVSFGIHNVDINDTKELQALGLNINADDLISASIHNLTSEFIKKMNKKGYNDLSFNEYLKLKIHGF